MRVASAPVSGMQLMYIINPGVYVVGGLDLNLDSFAGSLWSGHHMV